MIKAHCICVVSAKGGAGKTVLSASLATLISAMNRKVILVDCDAATNGLTLLYLPVLNAAKRSDRRSDRYGIFDTPDGLLPESINISDFLFLVPSSYSMLSTQSTSAELFRSALSRLIETTSDDDSNADFIILDAQAGTDEFAYAAVEFADEVIIVSEYDPVSAEGVERLKIEFGSRFPLGKTWTLYNKLLPDFATEVGRFLSVAGFLPPVPWDAEVIRSFSRRTLALDLENGNTFTLGMLSILEALLDVELGGEVSEWIARQASGIKEPIKKRLAELDKEIDRIERASVETAYEIEKVTRLKKSRPILASGGSLVLFACLAAALSLYAINRTAAYAIIGFGVTAFVAAIILLVRARPRASVVDLEATRRSLDRTIASLVEERGRYKMLADASVEQLLSGRPFS